MTMTRPHQKHNTMCHFPHSRCLFLYVGEQLRALVRHFDSTLDDEPQQKIRWGFSYSAFQQVHTYTYTHTGRQGAAAATTAAALFAVRPN